MLLHRLGQFGKTVLFHHIEVPVARNYIFTVNIDKNEWFEKSKINYYRTEEMKLLGKNKREAKTPL